MGAGGSGLFQEILFAPEGLAPVHHGLGLGAQAVEKNGGGEDDPVCSTDRSKDLDHSILLDTDAGLGAAAAILTGLDVQGIEMIDLNVVSRSLEGFDRLVHQDLGIAAEARASIECYDFQLLFRL